MDWSIRNIIGIGMRIISNSNEVARVGQKVIAQIVQAEQLFGEVRELIAVIAPELLVDLHVVQTLPSRFEQEKHEFDAKWVQQSLNHLLHPQVKLKVDGIMGEKTSEAVSIYQDKRGLKVDGWVGVLTLARLQQDILEAHRAGRSV